MVVAMEMTTNAVFSRLPPCPITFTREDLLDIRQSTPQTFSPVFTHPEILVRSAAALCGAWTSRRQGKRAGALVKLREQGLRTPLPSLHLANVRSLPNKMDELLLLNRINKDFQDLLPCVLLKPGLVSLPLTAFYTCRASNSTVQTV